MVGLFGWALWIVNPCQQGNITHYHQNRKIILIKKIKHKTLKMNIIQANTLFLPLKIKKRILGIITQTLAIKKYPIATLLLVP